jgi:LysR family transcriptional regulator, glycine cleavage system transcriptional activator
MRRLPPLNALRFFEAAARHASFQQAAQELHVTASAVSHQIRTLEEHLGTALFRRDGRQVKLTREGDTYLQTVREGLALLGAATERIAVPQAGGVLTLSVAPAFASPWLIPRLVGFHRDNPEIEVRLISSMDLVDFTKSDVDAAIRYGSGNWPGLQSHRLFSEELVPMAHPSFLDGQNRLRSPADLREVTRLHVFSRPGQWRMWLEAAGMTDIDSEKGPKFQTTPLALDAAIAGQGVIIADRNLAIEHLRAKRLTVLFDVPFPSEYAYYLVYPENRGENPNIAAFRKWLLSETVQPHS